MISSSNRFNVLAEASSSSKEQETNVPATGSENTGDQPMQDSPQPGPPAQQGGQELGNLKASLSELSVDEQIANFKKRGAALLAEDDRKKKLRHDSSSLIVGESSASAASMQGLRKRRVSFDEAESSKRRRAGPLHPSQAVGEPAIAAAATELDNKTAGPDVATEKTSFASALAVPEAPALSPPNPFSRADIRNPRNPFLCVVQANDSSPIGSFAKDKRDWAFELTIDIGNPSDLTMTMRFLPFGVEGPQCGRTGWCLSDYVKGSWMVTDFKIHRVVDCPDNGDIYRRDVLAACENKGDKARLMCISLEAWPNLAHFEIIDQWKNPNPVVQELFSAVFTGRHPYQLRIWFRAPYHPDKFNKQCLSFFTRTFEQRGASSVKPAYNDDDVCSADHLEAQEAASST